MQNLTREVFDATASRYDLDRSKLVPGTDRMHRWLITLLPANAAQICDLGAGSGLLSIVLREHFPTAHIHLIDFSAPMLALAKQRLADDPHITFTQADYVTGELPTNLDGIASSFSIHHLDDADKRRLMPRLYAALKPGGVFVNMDHVAGPTAELEARYQDAWLQQCRALGATEQQITDSLYRQREDRRTPLETQLQWMREAGFKDADCWYKEAGFAVLAGSRT